MARYEVTWDYEGSHAPITNYSHKREEALGWFASLVQKATGVAPVARDIPAPTRPERITLRKIGPDEKVVSVLAAYDVKGLSQDSINID